jgi:Sigma-70 region 2
MRNKDDSRHREHIQTQGACDENRLATFNQYRGLLFSIAYRMLGSVADAEDMLQESFIRWQEVSDIRSPRAFLVTIISRLCRPAVQSVCAGAQRPARAISSGNPQGRYGGISRPSFSRCCASLGWRWKGHCALRSDPWSRNSRPRLTDELQKERTEESFEEIY